MMHTGAKRTVSKPRTALELGGDRGMIQVSLDPRDHSYIKVTRFNRLGGHSTVSFPRQVANQVCDMIGDAIDASRQIDAGTFSNE